MPHTTPETPTDTTRQPARRVAILFREGRINRIVSDDGTAVEIMLADEPRGGLFNAGSVEWTQPQHDAALIDFLWAQAGPPSSRRDPFADPPS